MPDLTVLFHELLRQRDVGASSKNLHFNARSTSTSKDHVARNLVLRPPKRNPLQPADKQFAKLQTEFRGTSDELARTLTTAKTLLKTARKPYLTSSHRQSDTIISTSTSTTSTSFQILSTTIHVPMRMNNTQKSELDLLLQNTFRILVGRIEMLKKLHSVLTEKEADTGGFGLFSTISTSFKEEPQTKIHRQSVLHCLEKWVLDLIASWKEMQTLRLERMGGLDLGTNVITDAIVSRNYTRKYTTTSMEEEEESQPHQNVDAKKLQLLQSENEALLNKLQQDFEGVRTTTNTLSQISFLHSSLYTHLSSQSSTISSLLSDATESSHYIELGNKELSKNKTSGRVWILVFFFVMSVVVLWIDWWEG